MQVAGDGTRITADKLREAILQSRSLERALLGFAHRFMNQAASTALSNGTATVEERLASPKSARSARRALFKECEDH